MPAYPNHCIGWFVTASVRRGIIVNLVTCVITGQGNYQILNLVKSVFFIVLSFYPARARSALARRACALRALGLLLAAVLPQ